MDDLHELYQELILDHNRRPRNQRRPDGADHHAEGFNPLCGDRVTVYLSIDGDVVRDIGFEGTGCAISTASASIMTESIKGKTLEEVSLLFKTFQDLVTGRSEPDMGTPGLERLSAFAGVRRFPIRVKCATLAWHTLKAAIENAGQPVSTE